jgi:hypothetical protein
MTDRKRSERSRWTKVFVLNEPWPNAEGGIKAKEQYGQLLAVVEAFEAVGRVVRVEKAKYGNTLTLKARRA